MTITPELRHAIELSGGEFVRLEDPDKKEAYVLMKATTFEKIRGLLGPLSGLGSDSRLSDLYRAADEAFREGWEAPGMSDYDEYEKHRT